MKKFITKITEDGVLVIPDEIIESLKLKVGDNLRISYDVNGMITLQKTGEE
jgi:bifunctional DNA-binding transcriptional regulator/antitoxin component of YhaV-PrlF toxin-antitoxin module